MTNYFVTYHYTTKTLLTGYSETYFTTDKLTKENIEEVKLKIIETSAVPLKSINLINITKLDD